MGPAPAGRKKVRKTLYNAAAALLRQGKCPDAVASQLGLDTEVVSAIARREGIPVSTELAVNREFSRAVSACVLYNNLRRIALCDKALSVASQLLDGLQTPKDLQVWAAAYKDLVGVRRLEEGSSTERTEVVDTRIRDQVMSKLQNLSRLRLVESDERTENTA